jgi:hypothetical protein
MKHRKHHFRGIAWWRPAAFLAGMILACAPGLQAGEKPWTMVLLPDTQGYTDPDYDGGTPEIFIKQTEWIAAEKTKRDIRLVLHLGDITNRNTHPQWLNARRAMDVLVRAEVPFALVPGNHDTGRWGSSKDRGTFLNDYFGWFDYRFMNKRGYYETGHLENTYQTLDTPWGAFLVLALEYFPRDRVLEWANIQAKRHADHHAILLTHAYLSPDDERISKVGERAAAYQGGANSGEQMWQKLVSKHPNFSFVFCGHVTGDGAGHLASKGEHGNEVHQMVVNFQPGVKPERRPGGGGFLRILEFQPDRKTIKASTYSPWLDQWLVEPEHQYSITLAKPFGD